MTKAREYLQFLALLIPTVVVLLLAAVSLTSTEVLGAETIQAPVLLPACVDDGGREAAY